LSKNEQLKMNSDSIGGHMAISGNVRKNRLIVLSSASILCGFAGVSFPLLNQIPGMAPVFKTLWAPFLGSTVPESNIDNMITFLLGFGGAYILGWTVLTQVLIWIPLRRGEKWAWWAVLAGILSCFAIDEGYSLYFGVMINAVGNLVLFAWLIIALLFVRPRGAQNDQGGRSTV
jgi:hypothetical protein